MSIPDLYKIFEKYPIVSTDSRNISENCIFFALKGDSFNGNIYADEALKKGARFCVVDEKKYAINDSILLVHDVLQTLQKLAKFHRAQLSIPIIGITGSNGKTTTKELIREALSAKYNVFATTGNLNNHIGVPLSLLSINKSHQIAIIEMGANHVGEIAFLSELSRPTHGIITNVGKAHLEGFGGFQGVIKGKSELYHFLLNNQGVVFVNESDKNLMKMASIFEDIMSYNGPNNNLLEVAFLGLNPFVEFRVENKDYTSQMLGTYNFANISAALNIAKYFDVDIKAAIKKIADYKPENNRSQVTKINNHTVILDAYNANPTSMKAAIESFHAMKAKNKTLILGDMFELGITEQEEHQNIVILCEKLNFKNVFLCGKAFLKTTANRYSKFENVTELKKQFNIDSIPESLILVKGSRGMKLETIFK